MKLAIAFIILQTVISAPVNGAKLASLALAVPLSFSGAVSSGSVITPIVQNHIPKDDVIEPIIVNVASSSESSPLDRWRNTRIVERISERIPETLNIAQNQREFPEIPVRDDPVENETRQRNRSERRRQMKLLKALHQSSSQSKIKQIKYPKSKVDRIKQPRRI